MGSCKLSHVGGLHFDMLGLFFVKEGKEETTDALIWPMVVKKCKQIFGLWNRAEVMEEKKG